MSDQLEKSIIEDNLHTIEYYRGLSDYYKTKYFDVLNSNSWKSTAVIREIHELGKGMPEKENFQNFQAFSSWIEANKGFIVSKYQVLKTQYLSGRKILVCCKNFSESLSVSRAAMLNGDNPIILLREKDAKTGREQCIREHIPAVYVPLKYVKQFFNNSLNIFDCIIRNEKQLAKIIQEPDKEIKNTIHTDVSIIIPTYNAGKNFEKSLALLKKQQFVSNIEIVVVDSGSGDGTTNIAKRYGCKLITIRHDEFSHSYARNLGEQHSSGKIIVFLTQDAVPTSRRWLYRLIKPIAFDGFAASSCTEMCPEYADPYYRIAADEHAQYLGLWDKDQTCEFNENDSEAEYRRKASLSDISCAVRKSIFEKYYYHNNFAEDLELGMKILRDGYKIKLLGSLQTIHYHNRSAGYYLKRNFTEQRSFQRLLCDHQPKSCSIEKSAYYIVSTFQRLAWVIQQCKNMDKISIDTAINLVPTLLRDSFWTSEIGDESCVEEQIGDSLCQSLYKELRPYARVDNYAGSEQNLIIENMIDFLLNQFKNYYQKYGNRKNNVLEDIQSCLLKRAANESGRYLSMTEFDQEFLNKYGLTKDI